MRAWLIVIFLMSTLMLSSCLDPLATNQATVTYYTEPAYGYIYEGDVARGRAPVTLSYTLNGSATTTAPVTAVWMSGARQEYRTTISGGTHWQATISRRANAPGFAIDVTYADRIKAEKEKALNDAADNILKAISPPSQPQVTCQYNGSGQYLCR